MRSCETPPRPPAPGNITSPARRDICEREALLGPVFFAIPSCITDTYVGDVIPAPQPTLPTYSHLHLSAVHNHRCAPIPHIHNAVFSFRQFTLVHLAYRAISFFASSFIQPVSPRVYIIKAPVYCCRQISPATARKPRRISLAVRPWDHEPGYGKPRILSMRISGHGQTQD